MNLSEFKAWFEGFTESMSGPPTAKAWKRICDRVKQIKDAPPVERHHFHDYYLRPWRRFYDYGSYWGMEDTVSIGTSAVSLNTSVASQNLSMTPDAGMALQNTKNALSHQQSVSVSTNDFDPRDAFAKLGRAEALSLTAR